MKVISTPESTSLLVGLLLVSTTYCFSPHAAIHRPSIARTSSLASSSTPTQAVPLSSTQTDESVHDDQNDAVVRSPLRFLGPYPTMPLRFPQLATASQRERNVTGICLDFVLDTAANTNTINAQVAQELGLEKVGEAPGGVGSAGSISGGDTFMLGDCELDIKINKAMSNDEEGTADEKEEEDDTFTFMQGLTASALPVASPAAAGLLGLSFFYCFEGGVEFQWGIDKSLEQIPSVTFYGSENDVNVDELVRVPFESLPVSLLPSVTLIINGKEIPALFDTGSPITVLNARAAQEAGIDPTISLDEAKENGGSWNPFSKIASNIQSAQEIAKATASGDILTIAGTDGKPVRLVKSKESEAVNIKSSTGEKLLSESQVFIGDIPGLAALGGLGGEAPPAAVLGMDVLSRLPRVLSRARQNEIYL